MKTLTKLTNLFTSLSNNTSSTNSTLGQQLINDQHRFLLQKYFDNEQTSTTTTVGGQSLVLTVAPAINDTSATLTTTWLNPTNYQLVNFSSGEQRNVLFTYNSSAISWADGLTKTATTAISTTGVQYYTIPMNISKIKDLTISIGQLKYKPNEIRTRQEWDAVNFLPYTSDIPQYYFIYRTQVGLQLGIFPIPSTTGNIITYNFKMRVPDLTYVDVTDGHIASSGMVVGSTAVTGTGTAWTSTDAFPSGVDLTFDNLFISATPPNGDGLWYQIRQFSSDTSLTLVSPVISAPNITASTAYTIGQIPLLSEDFHDMLVFGALKTYYSSIVQDTARFQQFDSLYRERLELLAQYAGTKAADVDLGQAPPLMNPNLFIYSQ